MQTFIENKPLVSAIKLIGYKSVKSENHHQIWQIQTSLRIKFQLQLTVLNFWTKLTKNMCFWSKNEKKNHHPIFHIQISLSSKFQLQQTILIFWKKCSKTGYFWLNLKKWRSPLNFSYSNYSKYQTLVWTDNFAFLDQICLKREFWVSKNKLNKNQFNLAFLIF